MNLLAIETSGTSLSVAVKKGPRPVREANIKGFSRHVENLIPLIDRLLKKEGLTIRNIDVFLIGRGPGSFTGLRVGFATLKGFLAVRERPCFGAYSFDLVAAGLDKKGDRPLFPKKGPVPFLVASAIPPTLRPGLRVNSETRSQSGGNLAVCLNAKRDKLYTRSYRYHRQGLRPVGAPSVENPSEWLKKLPEGAWVAGDGLSICDQALLKNLNPLPEKYWLPKASVLIKLYERKDPMLRELKKPKDFLPFYLRASEAEERLKKKSP